MSLKVPAQNHSIASKKTVIKVAHFNILSVRNLTRQDKVKKEIIQDLGGNWSILSKVEIHPYSRMHINSNSQRSSAEPSMDH